MIHPLSITTEEDQVSIHACHSFFIMGIVGSCESCWGSDWRILHDYWMMMMLLEIKVGKMGM